MKCDIGWIIILGFVSLVVFLFVIAVRHNIDYRLGYIECFLDMQNNKPMKYVLKKQTNGETIWVKAAR